MMIRIFFVVLAWGGLLLFAGYLLEAGGRVFNRGGGDSPAEAERQAAPPAAS